MRNKWALLLTATLPFGVSTSPTFQARDLLAPQAILDYATYQGVANPLLGVNSFLGMPYATAARFDNPVLYNKSLSGIQSATAYGPACPQHELVALTSDVVPEVAGLLGLAESVLGKVLSQSEDCLSVNVQVPQNATPDSNLPILFWIHGGGFTSGGSSAFVSETTAVPGIAYQGATIVQRSVEMNQPVIFVSINYRLNAFGFSGGKEIEDAGVTNLGLKDQRLAMQWVQKHISKFGGDPTKVTIAGESAGAWSVSTHLLLNDGNPEGLFRGAIAMSGGALKVDGQQRQQGVFDEMVRSVGCETASDKLSCVRAAPYDAVYAAVQEQPLYLGYTSLAEKWFPRPDGTFLKDSPHRLVEAGIIADVPVIIGDMRDEGTLFALLPQLNTTTDDEFKDYFQTTWWPNATDAQVEKLMELYPQDPTAGSPFGTGDLNNLFPQYKRLAALIGDYSFQAQRRQLLETIPTGQKVWTYEVDQSLPLLGQVPALDQLGLTDVPLLGSFHVSETILNLFGLLPAAISKNTLAIMSMWISFTNTLDPNNHGVSSLPEWPAWNSTALSQYRFQEAGPAVIQDNYRADGMKYINDNAESLLV
ncbi:putative secreted lipase [Lachnellula arida]|uniref:Carboxylic ester hydrolase n=1 Tax=Lachnellula arida TaxID=1316785 RepID=A0A8T9BCS1_9HELO|nr:putative secreted lipase [Lachnellula arida]